MTGQGAQECMKNDEIIEIEIRFLIQDFFLK